MNTRAVIYARVSTDMQRDNFSIPSQVASTLEYAKQKGYAVVGDRYVDSITGFDTPSDEGSVPAYVDDYTSRELSRPGLDAAFEFLAVCRRNKNITNENSLPKQNRPVILAKKV